MTKRFVWKSENCKFGTTEREAGNDRNSHQITQYYIVLAETRKIVHVSGRRHWQNEDRKIN